MFVTSMISLHTLSDHVSDRGMVTTVIIHHLSPVAAEAHALLLQGTVC